MRLSAEVCYIIIGRGYSTKRKKNVNFLWNPVFAQSSFRNEIGLKARHMALTDVFVSHIISMIVLIVGVIVVVVGVIIVGVGLLLLYAASFIH